MKKLVAFAVVALLVVGVVKLVSGKTTEGRARKACENLIAQCESLAKLGGEKLSSDDADECAKDVSDAKDELGSSYDDVTSCMADASSCGEALGCLVGGAGNVINDELEGFGKGFERTFKK